MVAAAAAAAAAGAAAAATATAVAATAVAAAATPVRVAEEAAPVSVVSREAWKEEKKRGKKQKVSSMSSIRWASGETVRERPSPRHRTMCRQLSPCY